MSNTANSASIDAEEIAKFSAMADQWWDEDGKFKPLHKFNPVRISYIRQKIIDRFGSVDGITILDVGCGGGLLSVPLTQLGAKVTGIDASEKNINVAKSHAPEIDYRCVSVEELAETDQKFDVVLNMEVLEHVADVQSFLTASSALVKGGGFMVAATLNRTLRSYALAIVGAEYILNWLPHGTHSWDKFLKPHEIKGNLQDSGLQLLEIKGVSYNPFADNWSLSDDISVNYMMLFGKNS